MSGTSGVDLNLVGLDSLSDVLNRIQGGSDMLRLIAKLGFWTQATHSSPAPLPAFPRSYSNLEPSQLSDAAAYWQAEKARVDEVVGVLNALKERLAVVEKREQAAARSRAARAATEAAASASEKGEPVEKLTVSQLADRALLDPAVQDVMEAISLVSMLLAAATAHRDAVLTVITGMSREVSYRSAMLSARVY